MDKVELPKIDFDGQIVKPSTRGYVCPFRCHDSRYPAPTWKTEKGFRQHMITCPHAPSNLKRDEERRESLFLENVAKAKYKVGDTISYVCEVITKPTHESRWGRLVRVRYEPEKYYRADRSEIRTIGWDGSVVYNGHIQERDICASLEEAQKFAEERTTAWKEACQFAARCR